MAATLQNGDLISVILESRANAQQLLLTTCWKLEFSGGATDPDMDDAFTALDTAFRVAVTGLYATYVGCLNVTTDFNYVWIQKIYPTRHVRIPFPGTGPGTNVETELPQNVAAVVTLQNDDAGRQNVSNKHIGGIPNTFEENGLITVAGKAALDGLGAALTEPVTVTVGVFDYTFTPTIYHRQNPIISPVVNRYYTQSTSRVMRRRTVGQGS